jgi:CHASE2 domain-containing sensor protein
MGDGQGFQVINQDISASRGMSMAFIWRKLVMPVLVGLIVAAALITASRQGWLPEAPDRFTYDWRTTLLAERADAQRDDIAIVLIDEDSLNGYPFLSPVDRSLTAELIRAIDSAGAKAIGLDFIIDRPTDPASDAAFTAAIRDAKTPIIIGAVDERGAPREKETAFQDKFLAAVKRPAGHIYFATEKNVLTLGDQAVRFMVPPSTVPPARPSFTRLLAEIDGPKPEPETPLVHWMMPPAQGGADLFLSFTVPAHRDDNGKRTGAIFPESWLPALAGKIVLVGGAFTDRDRHLTPLTVASGQRISGIKIHAQILAQLRDGRSLYTMVWWAEFLLVALFAAFGYYAAQRWTLKGDGWRATAPAFVIILLMGIIAFGWFRVVLPSSTLFLAWPIGLLIGNRLDWAMAQVGQKFSRKTAA